MVLYHLRYGGNVCTWLRFPSNLFNLAHVLERWTEYGVGMVIVDWVG